jgi:ABC-type sugar transport system ATPase subunit
MLSARGISKRYGAVQALAGVDLEMAEGEIVALAGENGSGKSTLVKILAGVVALDAGEIVLNGERREFARPHDALHEGIALVAQDVTAVPALSVAENVLLTRLPGPLRAFRRRAAAGQAAPFLHRIGIASDPLAAFGSLKLGERELVEVAKALAAEPRFLLLDEVTSRLAEDGVARLFALVRELRDEGVSTLFITHRLAEICELADRTVVLRDGKRVGEIPKQQTTEERLSAMMVGRELTGFFHKQTIQAAGPVLRLEGLLVAGSSSPVSLDVRGGEILGVAGLVGAGRTELLETIAGVRRPRGGRVLVAGVEVTPGSPSAALEAGIALVPEDRHRQGLVLTQSVRGNLTLGSWRPLSFARQRQERAVAEKAVQRLAIKTPGVDAPIRALSGGNQQKVVLGRCLATNPKVLLLDEPTRGIDVGAKEEIFRMIGEMLERGIAILLVSSDLLEILGLADRVVVLHERNVVGQIERDQVTEERIALLAGGGRETPVG